MISVLGTYPLDLLRSRMAFTVDGVKRGLWPTFVATLRGADGSGLRGVRALYRGFLPTVAGIIPYAGISFFTYDTLKSVVAKHRSDGTGPPPPLSAPLRLVLGAVAGATAQTASYPLDVIRRRMQVHGMPGALNSAAYTSMTGAVRYVASRRGGG